MEAAPAGSCTCDHVAAHLAFLVLQHLRLCCSQLQAAVQKDTDFIITLLLLLLPNVIFLSNRACCKTPCRSWLR